MHVYTTLLCPHQARSRLIQKQHQWIRNDGDCNVDSFGLIQHPGAEKSMQRGQSDGESASESARHAYLSPRYPSVARVPDNSICTLFEVHLGNDALHRLLLLFDRLGVRQLHHARVFKHLPDRKIVHQGVKLLDLRDMN